MNNLIKVCILAFLTVAAGCTTFLSSPQPRFSQLSERAIAGPGDYEFPQWSPDGKLIAFLEPDRSILTVYEVANGKNWTMNLGRGITRFNWNPQGLLAYMIYRPDLSGNPYPEVFDLHIVESNGANDRVAFSGLFSPISFIWLADGQTFLALQTTADSHNGQQDIYRTDVATGQTALLVSRQMLTVDQINAFSLSKDETTLAVFGLRKSNDSVILVNVRTGKILQELAGNQVIPGAYIQSESFKWARDQSWVFSAGYARDGKCFGHSLFFLNVNDLPESFCIPTIKEAISGPDISPNLSQIVYITRVEPRAGFIMIADLTPEYRSRLEK